MVMITGDNPLTACHVARELRFTRCKVTLILTASEKDGLKKNDVVGAQLASWEWRSVDEMTSVPLDDSKAACNDLTQKFDLCITGEGLSYMQVIRHLVKTRQFSCLIFF